MPLESDDEPTLIRVATYHDIRSEAIEETELPNHQTAERIVEQMGADWFAAVIDALDEHARVDAVADLRALDASAILDTAGEALETDPENTCGARAEWQPPSGLSNA
jgi:Mg/Co/Ni transporter MgtE